MEIIIVVGLLIIGLALFDWAAMRWGANSNDGINSSEWSRRQHWPGFGGDGDE